MIPKRNLITDAGLRCNIITNAILLEKYAEDIVNLGVDEIVSHWMGLVKFTIQ